MYTQKILVVDDEPDMRALIRSFLTATGYQVFESSNGQDALSSIAKISPDLIIVDVMMPYMDGYALVKEIRKTLNVPIIFLSAKGEEWDRVKGLKLGADDYLSKPFYSEELTARIETVLRRANPPIQNSNWLKAGPFSLDQKNYSAFVADSEVSLTMKEFQLLSVLLMNKNNILSRRSLLETIWGLDYNGTERTVDTHVKTLRMKLGEQGQAIKTVWGLGYKFEV